MIFKNIPIVCNFKFLSIFSKSSLPLHAKRKSGGEFHSSFLPYCRRYAAIQPWNGDIMAAKSLWNIPINKKPHSGDIMVEKERPLPSALK